MKDWKKVLGGIAPTIATAIGGPLAGTATKFLASALLGKDEASEAELEAAVIGASPETLAKIKKIDNDFKAEMKRLDVDLERIAVDDRKSARDLAQDDMRPQVFISAVFIFGYFIVLWVLFGGNVELTEAQDRAAYMLLGVLTSGIPMILRFWFGGSPQDAAHMDRIYNSIPSDKVKR